MNRRGFLGALLAAAALDPERLLWTPGKKTISIPKPRMILRPGDRLSYEFVGKGGPIKWEDGVALMAKLRDREPGVMLVHPYTYAALIGRDGFLADQDYEVCDIKAVCLRPHIGAAYHVPSSIKVSIDRV